MDLTQFYEELLYPALFDRLPEAFPEFGFKINPGGGGYVSTTNRRFTHRDGKNTGQVYAFSNNPRRLFDWSESPNSITIFDYLQQRDSLSATWDVIHTLARLAGVEIPRQNPEASARLGALLRKAEILEAIFDFSRGCLQAKDNLYAKSEEAEAYRRYLTEERGYKVGEILRPKDQSSQDRPVIEVGYLPHRAAARLHLQGLQDENGNPRYSPEEIGEAIEVLGKTIGEEGYRLLIPFRRPSGTIAGFISRNIRFKLEEAASRPKYVYSPGLDKGGLLFNLQALKPKEPVVIVEGVFDALNATVKGLPNIVALGGVSLNEKQVQLLQRSRVKRVILLLDSDSAGQKGTKGAVELLLQNGLEAFIATLPDGVKDLDQLLQDNGLEAATEALKKAEPAYLFLLGQIISTYAAKGELSAIDEADFLRDITQGAAKLDRIGKERYLSVLLRLEAIKEMGVSREAIEAESGKIREEAEREKQSRRLSATLREADKLTKEGNTGEAISLIEGSLQGIRIERGKDLLPPYSFTDWESEIAAATEGKKTGIAALDKFVTIPPAAITLIAGRPSHGKTTFMYNLLLSMSEQYPEEKFYFFSYEEERKYILAKILNRLIDKDLTQYYPEGEGWNNYKFLKDYLKKGRRGIAEIETGLAALRRLLDEGRIEVVGTSYSVESLRSLIEAKARGEKIGAVFIDYIQRMNTERKTPDKRLEIGYISDAVLQIAKGTDIAVILGAQLNRDATKKNRPTLENLKEAGNLEEDANLVLSVYNDSKEKEEAGEGGGERTVELEIKALKNRDGEVNRTAKLNFDRWTYRIFDPAQTAQKHLF